MSMELIKLQRKIKSISHVKDQLNQRIFNFNSLTRWAKMKLIMKGASV